ncbi:hypothetical protein HDU84_007447 [Entophlyctis sp. JEL0112]|nr:hypothetical protein HDU84_007447 [Entophlyctis sp. JEL0112]
MTHLPRPQEHWQWTRECAAGRVRIRLPRRTCVRLAACVCLIAAAAGVWTAAVVAVLELVAPKSDNAVLLLQPEVEVDAAVTARAAAVTAGAAAFTVNLSSAFLTPRQHILLQRASATASLACDEFSSASFITNAHIPADVECGGNPALEDPLQPGLFDITTFPEVRPDYKWIKDNVMSGELAYKKTMIHRQNLLAKYLQNNSISVAADTEGEKYGASSFELSFNFTRNVSIGLREHGVPTSIGCGVIDPTIPQRYCETRNIALKLDKVPHHSKNSVKNKLDLPPSFGTLEGTCYLNENSWFGKGFGGGAAGWMFGGFSAGCSSQTEAKSLTADGLDILNPSKVANNIECDVWLDTPVFFISRWDTTNPYQFHQDALNTFFVYAILDLDPSAVHPVILDSRTPDGPFTQAWSHLFTDSRRLVDIRALADAAASAVAAARGGNGSRRAATTLCMSRATWGVHGGISVLARGARRQSTCANAAAVTAFRAFVLARVRAWAVRTAAALDECRRNAAELEWMPLRLGGGGVYSGLFEQRVHDLHRDACQTKLLAKRVELAAAVRAVVEKTIVVTYAIRKSGGVEIPNAGFLFGDQMNGFANTTWTGTDMTRKTRLKSSGDVKRLILNDDKVISNLKEAVQSWSRTKKIQVDFRTVDFALLSFDDQIAAAHATDVFVGSHGAVFAHLLYLRQLPVAGVVEMKPPDRGSQNQQFHNLAKKLGHL